MLFCRILSGFRQFGDSILGFQITACHGMTIPIQCFSAISMLIAVILKDLSQVVSSFITAKTECIFKQINRIFGTWRTPQTFELHQPHTNIGLRDFLLLSQILIDLIGTRITRLLPFSTETSRVLELGLNLFNP